MANDEVFMDIPQVENMAKSFNAFGDVLDGVAKTMSALSLTLKATAWLSFGANAAAIAYLDKIEPGVKKAAAKMKELNGDIISAIRSYRDGDNSGSRRFI
jgi:hypothetical protein